VETPMLRLVAVEASEVETPPLSVET
jgi:hypothetical protein